MIEGGEWKPIARKIILPTYEVFDEKRYFRSEDKVSILTKKVKGKTWKIGITICDDLWVNENIEGPPKYDLLENYIADRQEIKPEKPSPVRVIVM